MNSFLFVIQTYDTALLNVMRSLVDTSNIFLVQVLQLSTDILLIIVPIYLVIVWFTGKYYKKIEMKEYALKIGYSAVLGVLVSILLNLILPMRPRPEGVSVIAPLINHLPDNSFPSTHAIFTGAVLSALFLFYFPFLESTSGKMSFLFSTKMRGLMIVLGVVMVLSRIFVGIHYPGDIIAGLLVGILSAYALRWLVMQKWFYIPFIKYPIKIALFLKL